MQIKMMIPPARKYTALIQPDWWRFTSCSAKLGYIKAGMTTWLQISEKIMGFM